MKITSFQSEDGVVDALLRPSGRWVLRCVQGPAWFYLPATGRWHPASGPGFDLDTFEMEMPFALALLDVLECPARLSKVNQTVP